MKKYRIVMTVLLVAVLGLLAAAEMKPSAPEPAAAPSWSNTDMQNLKIN